MSSFPSASPEEPGAAAPAPADNSVEYRLRRQTQMLSVLTALQRGFLVGNPSSETFGQMLDQLIALTGSEYGFISEVLQDDAGESFLRMHGLSDISWSEESRTVFERMRSGGFEFHNLDSLFGAVVRTQAPVIANCPDTDPRRGGVPCGHPALKAFLGLPLFHGGELIGMVGLANAVGGYDEALLTELEPMTATCASMIVALRVEQERKRVEAMLNRRIGFERLVARISSELILARPQELDLHLSRALQEIGSFAEADRAYVFLVSADGLFVSNAYEWCAEGIEPQLDRLQNEPFDDGMLFSRTIKRFGIVDYPSVQSLPEEAAIDRALLEAQSIQSLLAVPMVANGHLLGFIGLDSVRKPRIWLDEEKTLMQLVGNAFTGVLERKHAYDSVRASEARYRSVVESVKEVIFQVDVAGRWVFLNRAWADLTGYPLERSLGTHFIDYVHTEDRELHLELMEEVLSGARDARAEAVRYRCTGGGFRWLEMNARPVVDDAGCVVGVSGTLNDITNQKEHEARLEFIAHYDPLTGLPNRVLLNDRLQRGMAQVVRRGQQLALAYIDLDGFKAVNDTHGHQVGDQLLKTLAARMKTTLREGDTVSRLGGDEFVAVLIDLPDTESCLLLTQRLLAALALPVPLAGHEVKVSASIGLTLFPQPDDVDADQLLRQADLAMYQAKLAGKNRYHVFDSAHDRCLRGRHEDLARIREGLSAGEFRMVYQPKVNMRTGRVIGVEALIRWAHPEHGEVEPARFLPTVEGHPLAVELGDWVVEQALAQITAWKRAGLELPVSVNISARHLQVPDFMMRLQSALARHPEVWPGSLELEVLETSALESITQTSRVVEACAAIGVSFALDDFGTGYSSLAYLKRLPAARLKIDQVFVRGMLQDAEDMAILKAILGLANAFRCEVIAEGVESVEHGERLLRLGCDVGQGYGIARPMPAERIAEWAASWSPPASWTLAPA
ncbi:putative signaling protein [Thauera sp. GDN1]|uniref:EAL domain-containing protein n=1 Tax=Thauera sp. GDN1 TaxID=2944810 RepID=UPI00247A120B|nr:EAL domain-containing protein [Thauera sp. GDN1]WEN42603.1 putative signaling protein [Thauera sp. GDN1]